MTESQEDEVPVRCGGEPVHLLGLKADAPGWTASQARSSVWLQGEVAVERPASVKMFHPITYLSFTTWDYRC